MSSARSVRLTDGRTGEARPESSDRLFARLLLALWPVAIVLSLGLFDGGSQPAVFGSLVAVTAVAVAVAVAASRRAPVAMSPPLALSVGAFTLLAIWTLASALWSGAPGRALPDFTRTSLYVLLLLVGFSLARAGISRTTALGAMTTAMCAVCLAGLLLGAAPALVGSASAPDGRLEEPLGYRNAVGLFAGVTLVLTLHWALAGKTGAARVAGAAGVALPAATLVLTFSRGALIAAIVAVAGFLLLGFARRQVAGLVISLSAVALGAGVSYAAAGVTGASADRTVVLLLLALAVISASAAAARHASLPLEDRLARLPRLSPHGRRVATVSVGAVAIVILGTGIASSVERLSGAGATALEEPADVRERLTEVSDNGRRLIYRTLVLGLRENPVKGAGAGTTELLWERHAREGWAIRDGHSVFVETLGELGAVGLNFLLIGLVALVGALVHRAYRGRDPLTAAIAGAGIGWILHAAVDYHWEIPATTAWLFLAGGMTLARPSSIGGLCFRGPALGVVVAALAVVALIGATVAYSDYQIKEAREALMAGNCDRAEMAAERARWPIDTRADAHVITAACRARDARWQSALSAAERALALDPHSGRRAYLVALARAAAGQDPLDLLRVARRNIRTDAQIDDFWLLAVTESRESVTHRARVLLTRPPTSTL